MSPTPAVSQWELATVTQVEHPAPDWVRLRLDVAPSARPRRAGQHYVVRLRAADGYTAQRSYSTASAPGDDSVELMVERMSDGEVSGHLHDEVRAGDQFEVRGPIGRWFTWDGTTPAVAFAGGSGLVPIVAMLRHARALGRPDLVRVIAVAKTRAALLYADELLAAAADGHAFVALTRENLVLPSGEVRVAATPYPDEVAPLLSRSGGIGAPAHDVAEAFVCGSVGFVGYASRLLTGQGFDPAKIRVETFGVTG